MAVNGLKRTQPVQMTSKKGTRLLTWLFLGILEAAGTPGFSMIMWFICGLLATFGALCYVEIGCVIPKTGGEYPVLDHVYGPTPAFLFAWVSFLLY